MKEWEKIKNKEVRKWESEYLEVEIKKKTAGNS